MPGPGKGAPVSTDGPGPRDVMGFAKGPSDGDTETQLGALTPGRAMETGAGGWGVPSGPPRLGMPGRG